MWHFQIFLVILGFLGSFGEDCGTLLFQEPSPEFLLKIKEHFGQRGSSAPLLFLLKVTKLIALPGQFSQRTFGFWLTFIIPEPGMNDQCEGGGVRE